MLTRAHAALAASVLLVLTALLAVLPATTATAQVGERNALVTRGTVTDDFELATVAKINKVRAAHGLRPIKRVIPCLDGLSENWGQRMVAEGLWEHRDQSRVVSACRLSWTGETLARGNFTPASLVNMWMHSPPHRAILLTTRARLAGIDVRSGGNGQYAAVLNLGDRG
ncbi:MAG: CAP domain-containing protein [Nocardioides sp.]|nr:CAP domain-containing protein [Nocardioides sp.]